MLKSKKKKRKEKKGRNLVVDIPNTSALAACFILLAWHRTSIPYECFLRASVAYLFLASSHFPCE